MSAGPLPWRGRRLHFVGVGGAGMSGYARLARALGAEVSGSDQANSPYAERLAADGVLRASIGHAVENLPAGEELEVIYSSAGRFSAAWPMLARSTPSAARRSAYGLFARSDPLTSAPSARARRA